MLRYIIRRFLTAIPTLLVVAVLIFVLIRCIPGNPAQVMLSEDATNEEVAAMERKLGLDQPIFVQFIKWISNAIRGDFGKSLYYNEPVLGILAARLGPTMLLVLYAMLIATTLGVGLGVIAAVNRGHIIDQIAMVISIVGISMPGFWIGLNLVIFFSVKNPIFPSVGYVSVAEGGVSHARFYLSLPAVALGLQRSASIARVTRSSMLDVLGNDYIRTARSKGLGNKKIIGLHALKNAANPIITQIGISVAHLMGGSVVMEKLFNIPGIGRLAFDSISRRDYPTIQGHILFVAVIYVFVNLLVDLLYKVFDPRIKYN